MHEIQTMEGVLGFNSTKHVHTAVFACVALDYCCLVYDVEFVGTGGNGEGRAWHYAHDAEDCAGGFPAFGTAAGVVVGDV